MNKNITKNKKIVTLLILSFLFLLVLIAFAYEVRANSEPSFSIDGLIKTNYAIGEKFSIPSCNVEKSGDTIEATHTLFFPDGSNTRADEVIFNTDGKYELEYSAVINGNFYSTKKIFYVNSPLYEIKGEYDNSAYWGNAIYNGKPVGEGIIANLKQGETFYFNQPINLSNLNGDNFIEFFNVPNIQGQYDGAVVITLTDVNDSNNKLFVRVKKYANSDAWANLVTYLEVSFDGKEYRSLRVPTKNSDGTIQGSGYITNISDMNYYYYETNSRFGSGVEYSIVGTPIIHERDPITNKLVGSHIGGVEDLSSRQMRIAYDVNTMEVSSKGVLVMDFDGTYLNSSGDEIPYYNSSELWGGFSANEVYLSIYGEGYLSNSINLVITRIGEYGKDELFINDLKDSKAPVLNIDLQGYDKNSLPIAIVGKDYPLFSANAYDDISGEIPVKVSVFTGYFSENPVYVPVENGKAKITKPLTYFIEYKATDNSGNSVTEVLQIPSISERENSLEAQIVGYGDTFVAGESSKIADSINIIGALGQDYWYIQAYCKTNQKTYEINDTDYIFTCCGEYELTLIFGDFFDEKSQKLTNIVVNGSENYYAFETIIFEKYYISNAIYQLPSLYANKYTDGEAEKILCSIYCSEDGGEFVLVDNGIYKPGNSSKVRFSYRINDKSVYESEEFRIINVGYKAQLENEIKNTTLDFNNYFFKEGCYTENSANGIDLFANSNEGSLEFINKVQVRSFALRFYFIENISDFNSFKITLTGVKFGKQLFVDFSLNNGILSYKINGGKSISYGTVDSYAVRINYSIENGMIYIDSNKISTDFDGFGEDFAYLSFSYAEIASKDSFGVVLEKINNQPLSYKTVDRISPEIVFTKHNGNVLYGGKFTIKGAIIADVLDSAVKAYLSVKQPDGSYVRADDGTILDERCDYTKDYVISVTQYGNYTISYYASDMSGNLTNKISATKSGIVYNVSCVDTQAPVITLFGENYSGERGELFKTISCQKGQNVAIEEITITDNISSNFETCVMVKTPQGAISLLKDNRLSLTSIGEYVVYFMVNDEAGNVTVAYYSIVVK